jgi:antitoxin Phd
MKRNARVDWEALDDLIFGYANQAGEAELMGAGGGETAAPVAGPGGTDSRDGVGPALPPFSVHRKLEARRRACYISDYLTRCGSMGRRVELTKARRSGGRTAAGRWKLEDAKARFSEVVRDAREYGPQRVSVRGHDAVVVMTVEEFDRLVQPKPRAPFVEFMEGLHLGGLDLTREADRGRDVEL